MEESQKEFAALVKRVACWQESGERVVLCHGCFDPLHAGHILHFKAAKRLADRLVVTVTPDRYVNKGPDRPLFPEDLRLETVLALRMVDAGALNLWDSAIETIRRLRPDYFAKGSDYRARGLCNPNFLLEEAEIHKIGGEVLYTDEMSFSSTELIRGMTSRTS